MINFSFKKFLCLFLFSSFSPSFFLFSLSFSLTPLPYIYSLSALFDYLNTHTIDPCNLFVAQYPSEIMLKFKYQHFQKGQEGRKRGEWERKGEGGEGERKEGGEGDEQNDENDENNDSSSSLTPPLTPPLSPPSFPPLSSPPLFNKRHSFQQKHHPPSFPTSPLSLSGSHSFPTTPSLSPFSPSFLPPQKLIDLFQNENFDSLQTVVSRWQNVKKCPNFVDTELSILKKLLEVSLPHSPGDLVAIEVDEIPQPQRYLDTY